MEKFPEPRDPQGSRMKRKPRKSPKWGERLLRVFLSSEDAESIAGDLEENYRDLLHSKTSFMARGWHWAQIFKAVVTAVSIWFTWNLSMLKTYMKLETSGGRRSTPLSA